MATGLAHGLQQDAYIWQRAWTPAVVKSVNEHSQHLGSLTCLAAEITPLLTDDEVVIIDLDYASLIQNGRPIILAVRVGNYPGPFTGEALTTRTLLRVIESVLARARDNNLAVAALEIDYDCATSKLSGYRDWLRLIRPKLGDIKLSITTLPTWMNRSKAFSDLIGAADQFVLQVHSIQRPRYPTDDIELCNAMQAYEWIIQANEFKRPFFVALPTYGYELAFDQAGALIEVAAEDASAIRQSDLIYRRIMADPSAMAKLIQQLSRNSPSHCMGVIWYRLPIEGERLNWDALTWRSVMQGFTAKSDWRISAVTKEDGVTEIQILQASPVAAKPPSMVQLKWSGAEALAWDAQRHYSVRSPTPTSLSWRRPAEVSALPEGARWTIGWVRFAGEAQLELSIIE